MNALTQTSPPIKNPKWSDRLAFDVALRLENSGETVDEIMARHEIKPTVFKKLNNDKLFKNRVTEYREEIREKGLTFRMKAKAQAEELLITSWNLIHTEGINPAVKEKLIANTVRWAGLEPRPEATIGENSTGGVQITINLPNNNETKEKVIEHDSS